MKFSRFSTYLAELERTASRLKITEILVRLLRETKTAEVDKICYLSLGRLAPLYEGTEFNLAEKLLVRIISVAFNENEAKVKKDYQKGGDLGETAFRIKSQRPKTKTQDLTVAEVDERLWLVAKETGSGSVERKIFKMARLLQDLDALSVKYVIRIPLGRLRLGFSELTILDALSWLVAGDKSKREKIEDAFNVQADIGQIAVLLKEKGLRGLNEVKVNLGIPVMPALCQRLPTADEMIEKMGKLAAEPKYDGTRLQLHFSRKKTEPEKEAQLFDFKPKVFIRTFTRNLENTTSMFPDIAQAAPEEIRAQEVILDGEAVGYDSKTGRFLPFQETIKRKRKYDVSATAKKIPIKYFCFDILYKDGQDLLKQPFRERRKVLEKILADGNKTLVISPQIITDSPKRLRQYHDQQKEKGLEGVVVKRLEATYDPGRRGYTWVKFKEEESKKGGGLADTIEAVVMGYNRGKGKRNQFGIGAFLIGIKKSEDADEFLTVSKIGTGLSDEQWREMYQRCEKKKTEGKPKQYLVDKNLTPAVWCHPGIVVEIQADNITISPIHTAGLALRFPRLVRFRDDKSAEEVTSLTEAKKLYRLQK